VEAHLRLQLGLLVEVVRTLELHLDQLLGELGDVGGERLSHLVRHVERILQILHPLGQDLRAPRLPISRLGELGDRRLPPLTLLLQLRL